MAEPEPLLTDNEVTNTNLSIQSFSPTSSPPTMARGKIPPTLPQDVLDLIFASLCPPAPSTWIHGTVDTHSARNRYAPPPSRPPDIIWPKDSGGNGDGYPVNALLLGDIDGDGARNQNQNQNFKEYKVAMATLAAAARTCSWARELAERYLYRYVVLVGGRQLAGFVAAVEGRFGFGVGLGADVGSKGLEKNSEGDVRKDLGFSRLGRYVWGVYCLVDMMREEDLDEWYQFEMRLEEWNTNRQRLISLRSGSGPVGEMEGQKEKEGEEGKKMKKKKKKKQKGKEKAGGVLDDILASLKAGSEEDDNQTVSPPKITQHDNLVAAPGGPSATRTAKANSSSARRNRRKRAQNTDHLIEPLDEIGTFFRLHSAMLDSDMYKRSSGGMSLTPRNLYNLFLRLLLSPAGTLLPNLTDLLCSWYVIQRVSGMVKEPDYLSSWIPGRVTLHPRPSALHKIRTFTIRPPVKHPADRDTPLLPFRDIQPTLGGILDAFPNVETFDTVFLSSCRSWGGWLYRPLLEASETPSERELRLDNLRAGIISSGSRTHPLKHMRVYRTSCSPATIAAFLQNLASGSLETLLVRFRHLGATDLDNTPGTILLGHDVLVNNGVGESLRFLELLSTPSRHYLTRTAEMQSNPRLRRLTCLPYLNKLGELVVDFQGLFGDLRSLGGLKEEDMDLLRRDACLPPNLETLKVLCVWSSGADQWYYISAPVGEYVVSGEDVVMFVEGVWRAHREGLLRCCKTLRRLVLVVPDRLKRISASAGDGGPEGTERARAREGVVVEEAGSYFEANGVEFVVERGMDVLDSARGT